MGANEDDRWIGGQEGATGGGGRAGMARHTPALTTSSRGTSIRAPPVATAAPPTGFTFMFASQHEKKKFPKKLNFPQSSRSQKKNQTAILPLRLERSTLPFCTKFKLSGVR